MSQGLEDMNDRRPVLCRTFGCRYTSYVPACDRCGLDLYDWPPHEDGWIWPIWRWIKLPAQWAMRVTVGRRCPVCRRWFWTRPTEACCSAECDKQNVPF